jgi:hypothetical protein
MVNRKKFLRFTAKNWRKKAAKTVKGVNLFANAKNAIKSRKCDKNL